MSEKLRFWQKPGVRKTVVSVLGVVLLLGGGVILQKRLANMRERPAQKEMEKPAAAVEVLEAQEETVTFIVNSQGSVEPRTNTVLVPEVSGLIAEVAPEFYEGGMFEKGDMLLQIESVDYEVARADADARLAEAELKLEEEKALAERALAEWRQLGNRGEPSPLTLREPQVRRAEAAVESAKAAVAKAARDIERTTIRAPYQGIVEEKMADVGQYVSPGTQLARIFAIDRAEVRLPVTQQELAYLDVPMVGRPDPDQPHPPVQFTARSGGKTFTWEGEVIRTEGAFDPRSRMLSLIAEVVDPYQTQTDGAERKPPLGVGMFVEAAVQGRTQPGIIRLPRRALRNNREVLVVNPENRIEIRLVELARTEQQTIYVSNGLEDGERVVTTPMEFVVEGMPVTPLQAEPSTREVNPDGAAKIEETGDERKS